MIREYAGSFVTIVEELHGVAIISDIYGYLHTVAIELLK